MRVRAFALGLACLLTACAGEARRVAELRNAPLPPIPDDPSLAHPPEVTPDTRAGATLVTESFDLDDGVHVIVVEKHEQPVLVTKLVLTRGVADLGEHAMPERLLLEASARGTTTRSAQKLVDDFDAIGGPLRWTTQLDGATLHLASPSTSLDGAIELLADVIRNPAFRPREMEPLFTRWKAIPVASSSNSILRVLYDEDHPYRRDRVIHGAAGEEPSIESLRSLHEIVFHPRHVTLIVVGDTTRESVEVAARRWLGAWTVSRGPLPVGHVSAQAAVQGQIFHEDDVSRETTTVSIVAAGPSPRDKDNVALEALLRVLRLVVGRQEPRVTRTPTGHAGFTGLLAEHREDSFVQFSEGFGASSVTGGTRAMLATLARARQGQLAAADLDTVRARWIAQWRHDVTQSEPTAARLANAVALDVPVERVALLRSVIAALTMADLQRVARTYLAEDKLRIVVRGAADGDALATLGFGPVIESKSESQR